MRSDQLPITVMHSMESHIAHLRVAMKNYNFDELLEIREIWQSSKTPPEYQKLINDELNFRDGSINVKRY